MRKYSAACQSESGSGVSEESRNRVRNHEYIDDPKLREHAFCMLKKAGFIDSNGDFQVEIIKTKLTENSDHPENVEQLVEKCAVKKDSPQLTSAKFVRCLHENRAS